MEDFIKNYGAFIAAIIAPIAAVLITIWYQNREARRKAQMDLFLDLVSFRDFYPLPWQYSVALNRIDVVFHRQADIRRIWHEYYDLLSQTQQERVPERAKEKKIELISAMAKYLGYKNIDQIYLQRYYLSQGQVDDVLFDAELRREFLRVLKSTETLYILGKYGDDPYSKDIAEGKIQGHKLSETNPLPGEEKKG
ncbi:MAG: DUF6680 family protein [Chitinophagaceae bacterium]